MFFSRLFLKELFSAILMVNVNNGVNSQDGVHRIIEENILKQILPGSVEIFFFNFC